MTNLLILLGLLILAFPIIAIVALVKSIGASERLRRIEMRLTTLEQGNHPLAAAPRSTTGITQPQPAKPEAKPVEPGLPVKDATTSTPEQPAPVPQSSIPAAAATRETATIREKSTSFEERFGTRWVVWVGGLALALGGLFLVKYSIDQDLIGPRLRLFLAGLFAAALIAAGEWIRRNEGAAKLPALPTAFIPGILTAAGTTVAYTTVYAAYGLYDFLVPAFAFVLLGAVALATLGAALLHGPALAALGLVGAYVTPRLVASETPDYWALYVYLAIVTAAAFALARFRLWPKLAIAAVAFGFLWTLPGFELLRVEALGAHVFHVGAGLALAALLIVCGLFYGPPAEPDKIEPISSTAVGAYLLAAALLVLGSHHDPLALWSLAALTAAGVAIAWRADATAPVLPVSALLVFLIMAEWAADTSIAHHVLASGPTRGVVPEPARANIVPHLIFGAGFAVLFGAGGFLAQGRSNNPLVSILWAGTAVLAPIAILIALYYRISHFDPSLSFAAIALVLAGIFGWATDQLSKRPLCPGRASAEALFATGCVAALALALTFSLEKGWLTVALAMMTPGIAWVAQKRPLPMLRPLAAALTVLVLLRVGWEPRIVGGDVGATPFFNWILYGYGVPALSFWFAGYILRQRGDDVPVRMVESAAILFTVLLAMLQIRHAMNDGNIYQSGAGLAELALQAATGLAMALGLEHVRMRSQSPVHDISALVVAGGTFVLIVCGLFIFRNPMITGMPVGGSFMNLILLGYGVTAVLAIALALRTRGLRPMAYRIVAVVTALGLALAYLSLEIRTLYHGPILTHGITSQMEQYTYSAVWLGFGVLLLLVGFALRSQPVRLASAAVLILTIAKVFLFDMAGLVGIYRALSFIGLGIVLVGIGLLYQRLLFPRHPPQRQTPATSQAS